MSVKKLIIGVEGSAAAGKSTMAATVSKEMSIPVIEGGKFYRQLTLLALQQEIDPADTDQLSKLARSLPERFTLLPDGTTRLDDEDVSDDLHQETISKNVANFA